MTVELFIRYSAVVLTIIALSLIVLLFFNLYTLFFKKEENIKNTTVESTFQKTIEDLDKLVQRKCFVAYRRVLQPYVSKALKTTPLINDKVVNEISLQITKEIILEMSDSYREKLEVIYKKEILNDVILEIVYNTVTEMAMKINKDNINKMNFINNLGTINRTDFDV